jgi:hypothetical protein
MATFKIFDEFFKDLAIDGVHGQMNSADYKLRLSNTAPNKATFETLSQVTAITGGGYADSTALPDMDWVENPDGTFTLGAATSDYTWTATGSAFTEFRYVYLYNDTATNDPLIGVLDYGSAVNIPEGGSFTVNAGASGWVVFTNPSWT